MCEVLRALVKCGGLFFMRTDFIRPLIWEVPTPWYGKY